MSMSTQAPYGVREFDLSTKRENKKITIKADNFAILSAEDSATIRVNSPDASAIPVREISGLTIAGEQGDPGIERIYLSNNAGSGKLRLLTGFGVASGDTSTPTDDTTDVSNREARELGKARLEESGGTLIDPATDGTSNPDIRELAVQSSLTNGQHTVATSGTAEALNGGTSLSVPNGGALRISALSGNAGSVYVGDSNVTTGNGYELQPGDQLPEPLRINDVSTVFVDADNGGDSVSWVIEQ